MGQSTKRVRRTGGKISPPVTDAELAAVAAWVATAKATLFALDDVYQRLKAEAADGRLHGLIDMGTVWWEVIDHGVSALDDITMPALAAIPAPFGKDGGE